MTDQIEPGMYRHFKGGYYHVLGSAKHSETLEEMVTYRHMGEKETWVRPAAMFVETVERDGKVMPRFERVPTKVMTLCEIIDGDRILLGYKKVRFGAGKWNGFGGKPEIGESVEDSVVRELREEIGIEVGAFERRGTMFFQFSDNPELVEVPLFLITRWSGDPVESEEVRPEWVAIRDIDYDSMWPDDRHWLPQFLAGKSIDGWFEFDESGAIEEMRVEFS